MYEELIAVLRHCGSLPCEGCPRKTCEGAMANMREAADAIEELSLIAESNERSAARWAETAEKAVEQIPNWIPVTERLPEKRKWVLCQCRANITDVLRFENAEWYHDPTHVYMFGFVTHWMQLPEPPEEVLSGTKE